MDERPSVIRKLITVLDFITDCLARVTTSLHIVVIVIGGLFLAVIFTVYALQTFK